MSKIFISCVSDEFRDYRDQLRTDLTSLNVEVKVQEDFKDSGLAAVASDDLYISACDAVVHLVGDMTGAMSKAASIQAILKKYPDIKERFPPLRELLERGEDISYTQWEAWLALYHDKPLLIAQAGEAAPRAPAYAPTVASRSAQQAHLDRLRAVEHYPRCTFVNADQLAKYVLASPILGPPKGQFGWLPYIGLLPGLLVLLVAPWAAEHWETTLGVHIAGPLTLVLIAAGFALPFVYTRYVIILGASDEPPGSRDRTGYDALRENLVTGGPATHLYARWLTVFLDRVDRFFGDVGIADRTLFPHAFGLKMPAPLWTAPAFDRCLLLALLYPVVTIFVMWAVSGDVGPAEQALGLAPSKPGWQRGIAAAAIGFGAFAYWRYIHASERKVVRLALAFAAVVAGSVASTAFVAVAVFLVGASVGAMARAFARVAGDAFAGAFVGAVALVAALAYVAVATVGAAAVTTAAGPSIIMVVAVNVLAVAAGPAVVIVALLYGAAIINQRQGVFLLSIVAAMISGCLMAAYSLASLSGWYLSGPVFLFLVLLTLLNAPFDWASLGLTRALLRRGLELKGWWPFVLALADAMAAIVIIALLALTMVLGVQLFDTLAVHGGGKAVLPLGPLFDGIAVHPEGPEYWWVYALLLSTMIPSLINLVIGGTALMRAVPGLPQVLLHFMPATGGVPTYDRAWIAAVLTLQAALGVVLGVAAQALVAWGLIFHLMPAVGLGLLDLARNLAGLDLPMRLIKLLAAS